MYDDFDHHKSDIILVCGWATACWYMPGDLTWANEIAQSKS